MKTITNAVEVSSGLPHSGVSVPEMVYRGVARCERLQPQSRRGCTPAERAARLERRAELFRREARWWGVLFAWLSSVDANGVPWVFIKAALNSQVLANEFASEYERMAEESRRRAAVLAGEL